MQQPRRGLKLETTVRQDQGKRGVIEVGSVPRRARPSSSIRTGTPMTLTPSGLLSEPSLATCPCSGTVRPLS